jgi:heme oxygenase
MNLMLPSVRMRLRAATEEIHQALHHAAPFAAIAEGRETLAGYGETLRALYRFHAAMHATCVAGAAALDAAVLGEAHGARIEALARDLAQLGLARPEAVPEMAGEGAFYAGVLYTVQGSTLGGKVIFRQLDALLPDARGRSFFQGRTEDARHWQMLCAALEACGDVAGLEAGARHGFECFAVLLCGASRELLRT